MPKRLPKPSRHNPLIQKASYEDVRRAFGEGRYLVYPSVPRDSEQPKHIRDFTMFPTGSKDKPEDIMKRHCITAINVKGCKKEHDTSIGQDMFSSTYLGQGWFFDLVADGHGHCGDVVAERVCRMLPYFMNSKEVSSKLKQGRFEEAFQSAFERTQEEIVDALGATHNLMFSGSTCVCALRQAGSSQIHIAHVGDSKAIMFGPDGTVVKRTIDHKPDNPRERQRVEEMGCEVISHEHGDGVLLDKVYIKGQRYPAISFTRSFGDQCVKANGVDSDPEVSVWDVAASSNKGGVFGKLKTNDTVAEEGYILLASDGIWEFLEPSEVAKFVCDGLKRGATKEEVLRQLTELSQEKWHENEDEYLDDITVLLLPVKAPEPAPPVVLPSTCFSACSVM